MKKNVNKRKNMLISTLWRSVSDEMFSGTVKSVRVMECALEDVCFREVPL